MIEQITADKSGEEEKNYLLSEADFNLSNLLSKDRTKEIRKVFE